MPKLFDEQVIYHFVKLNICLWFSTKSNFLHSGGYG